MSTLSHAVWRKSRRSSGGGQNCVELAGLSGTIAVRDSKNPGGGALTFDLPVMGSLVKSIKAGRYDL
jgi:hypothetical protein